jgi:DHA1 family inner membrane transport protein
LAVGGFGIGTTEFATMGLLPYIASSLHVSIPTAGHAITSYALGVVVGAPLITGLAARLPRKGLLIGLMAAFALGNGLSALSPSANVLLIARFVAGLPHGAFFGVAAVVASSLVPAHRKSHAVSLVMVGLTIANIVGVPLATFLGQQLGWRSAYLAVAVIGVLTMAAIQLWVPRIPADPDASVRRELSAFRNQQVWFALITGVVGFSGLFALYSYITPTMTTVAHVSESTIPWVLAVFGLGMTVGAIVAGRFIHRSVMGTVYCSMLAVAASLTMYAVTLHHAVVAIGFVFLLSFSSQTLASALQVWLMTAGSKAPSLAAASNHSALNIANATGAWYGGLTISVGLGYVAAIWVGVGVTLLGLAIAASSRTYRTA